MHKINTCDNWLTDADADAEDYGVTFSRPNLGIKPDGIRGFRIQLSPVSQTISSPNHRAYFALRCPAEEKAPSYFPIDISPMFPGTFIKIDFCSIYGKIN